MKKPIGTHDPKVQQIDMGLPLPRLPAWRTAHEATRIRWIWDILAAGLRGIVD